MSLSDTLKLGNVDQHDEVVEQHSLNDTPTKIMKLKLHLGEFHFERLVKFDVIFSWFIATRAISRWTNNYRLLTDKILKQADIVSAFLNVRMYVCTSVRHKMYHYEPRTNEWIYGSANFAICLHAGELKSLPIFIQIVYALDLHFQRFESSIYGCLYVVISPTVI